MAENPATLIESGFASRANTHKVKQVAKKITSQKFDSCSLHSLGQLPKRADESESVCSPIATYRFPGSNISSPNATLVLRKQHQFT